MVLLDVEWIEPTPGNRNITQISALRVNEDWSREEEFNILIRPWDVQACYINHIGLGGYPAEDYLNAPREEVAFQKLAQFLRPAEVLCFWHYESMMALQQTWKRVLGGGLRHTAHCASHKVENAVKSYGITSGNPYRISKALGLEVPSLEHRASNDVLVFYKLLVLLAVNKDYIVLAKPNPKPKKKKAKKLSEEERATIKRRYTLNDAPFAYFYSKASKVFHTRSCRVLHAIKDIQGCARYRTAAQGREPCKLCHPQEDAATSSAPSKADQARKKHNDEVIRARMLGGDTIEIKRGKLVGCCHNLIHPGKMHKALLEQHDCLGKKCPFFEKYPESPYWEAEARKAKERAARKQEKKKTRAVALATESSMVKLREKLQACADATQSSMDVIRAEEAPNGLITVFYVSDNPFADGNRFQPFIAEALQRHHCRRIALRHIRDVDGHFVTREEFHARNRKWVR